MADVRRFITKLFMFPKRFFRVIGFLTFLLVFLMIVLNGSFLKPKWQYYHKISHESIEKARAFVDNFEHRVFKYGKEFDNRKDSDGSMDKSGGPLVKNIGNDQTSKEGRNSLNNTTSPKHQDRPRRKIPKTPSTNFWNTKISREDIGKLEKGFHLHVWYHVCAPNIDVLCQYPLFPKGPDVISVAHRLDLMRNETEFGQRMFGYIVPPITGQYQFAVSSDDSSEIFLSTDSDPRNSKLICQVGNRNEAYVYTERNDFRRMPQQQSKLIRLTKNEAYFLDILHVQGGGGDSFQLAWKLPGKDNFAIVEIEFLRLVKGLPREVSKIYAGMTVECMGCDQKRHHHMAFWEGDENPRYIKHEEVKDAFPTCPYNPSYITHGELPEGRHQAISLYNTPVYQYPSIEKTGVVNFDQYDFYRIHPLDFKDAAITAEMYIEQLDKKYPGKFKMLNIINVEKKIDPKRGARYLMELNVTVKGEERPAVLSQYIFGDSKSFCYPENLQWNRTAKIALIITLRNQGRWMAHFLDNLQDIYIHSSRDQHVSLIVYDYESEDLDIERELSKRSLPPYKLIKKAGAYSRVQSFNAAIRTVTDSHTIIFTVDLHLELPYSLFDDIRKHCFEGRSAYTPIIVRLRCGHSPLNPRGKWEVQGFGIIGIYKSDWDRIGGLNEERFKDKWGGEDWEMMERLVGGGLEYERLRTHGIYHYQHSRKGMWTGDHLISQMSD